jgi:hypothetical protein
MARSTTYPLVDRILDGRLGEILTTWRGEGLTLLEMTFRLRTEHDIKVSVATVQRWIADLEAESGDAA